MRAPQRIYEIVNRLIEALEAAGYAVEEAYLFGSWARGDWLETSDVDLVVVSRGFAGLGWAKRLDLINKLQLRLRLDKYVEVLPYTPEEFRQKLEESIVLRDAKRYWIRVR
ncbi:MAG: nucleotidyltransferase domain-containing protein [Thermoproteus sp. AZ2]|jgi:predicted nucleotidyltransferase|uniref:Nucleotidyltransferase domain-containing protein n=1 Tax=Thermoproteus sp. AZ2 TaxID=1609232 RepID=A0ACC6UYM4_9CREN|nr:MAG: DNA polymerase subunit beta [Thermoproteus sp. AZ2]